MTTVAHRIAPLGLALLLAAGIGLAGCGADGTESSSAGSSSADVAASAPDEVGRAGRPALQEGGSSADAVLGAKAASTVRTASATAPDPSTEPAVIQTGSLTVESEDVGGARFELDKVLDAVGGSVADEKTTASDDGEVRLSRIELRVPSEEFDTAMTDLGRLGKVTEATREAQDVTGQLIDTEARIRAQEQSLERIEVLFGRARNIRDIVSIESQLSRRQAELDSLQGQLAYLEDQTTFSTITVYLEGTEEQAAPPEDDLAFVGGLKDGWRALGGLGAALAAVTGALLPFALVVALVAVPATVVGRRVLARRPTARPTAGA